MTAGNDRALGLDLDRLLLVARRAAAAGSAEVRAAFGAARDVTEKASGDWVSHADHASEDAIRRVLETEAPELSFFGEESGGERTDAGWFVDPLDGTTNFLHGFPIVGVSIGLVAHGVPVVGVVEAPLMGDTYWARQGGGAFRNGERIVVSARPPHQAVCALGFPFRSKREFVDDFIPVVAAALHAFEDLRRPGAASLDLAWTAAGVFDGYFEQFLGTWDVAAGGVLVREAGGVVTDFVGDDRAWLDSGHVVAGPPAVHERLLEVIASSLS